MKYLTSTQIKNEYLISDSTLWRWRKDSNNPFPKPHYKGMGGKESLYIAEDVKAWEEKGGMQALSHQISKRTHTHAI